MKKLTTYLFGLAVFILTVLPAAGQNNIQTSYQDIASQIIDASLADSSAFDRLAYLCDIFGPRFSGSQSLEDAIDWVASEMKMDGLDRPHTEPVMIPHWVRGEESLYMIEPRTHNMPLLGLGGSVGTPAEGITAEVLVVTSRDDLDARKDEVAGKIVLFNVPFTSYGATVQYRVNGAVWAGGYGAVASLIRSVGPVSLQTPHTGSSHYADSIKAIPHAAITLEDAELLQRMQNRGVPVRLTLKMEAETLPDSPSRNVMAEVTGSEFPNEVIVLGGHIDSWDVGQGAMDDGGGVVAAWEAVRLLKELGLKPKRTIRVVGWTNEENGLRGGVAYHAAHPDTTTEKHIVAMETDSGVFKPSGFGFTGSDEAFAIVQQIGALLNRIESGTVTRGGGGADISPLMRAGVPGMGLKVDESKYFWYHHTHADTIDKLDPHELNLCVATMAVMAYIIADMPDQLPR